MKLHGDISRFWCVLCGKYFYFSGLNEEKEETEEKEVGKREEERGEGEERREDEKEKRKEKGSGFLLLQEAMRKKEAPFCTDKQCGLFHKPRRQRRRKRRGKEEEEEEEEENRAIIRPGIVFYGEKIFEDGNVKDHEQIRSENERGKRRGGKERRKEEEESLPNKNQTRQQQQQQQQQPKNTFQNIVEEEEIDLLIIMGTSLSVKPVSQYPLSVKWDTPQILINRERVGSPNEFDCYLIGDCVDWIRKLCHVLGWQLE